MLEWAIRGSRPEKTFLPSWLDPQAPDFYILYFYGHWSDKENSYSYSVPFSLFLIWTPGSISAFINIWNILFGLAAHVNTNSNHLLGLVSW
jgi:hypothetical protein